MSKLRTNEISPVSGSQISVGAPPSADPSALLNIQSTTQGFSPPKMTTAQRDAIVSPSGGLTIFNTDTQALEHYNTTASAWESVDGIQSINGRTAKSQILNTGSAGTAPVVTPSGTDTNTINIPLASTAGVTAGLISKVNFDSFNTRLFPAKNIKYVVKNTTLGPQDYNSIKDAIDSITDNSSTNPYLVWVSPGIYTEDTITLKSFVTLSSDGNSTVTIQPSNPANDIIQIAGSSCRLQGVTLQGATGASAAAVRILSAPVASVLDFITINNCTEEIVCESTATEVQVVLRNIRLIASAATKKLLRITANGSNAIVRVYSAILTDDVGTLFEDAILVTGPGSRIDANTMLVRSTVGVGYGLRAENGAEIVSQVGAEFEGFDTNFGTENVGSAPLIRTNTIMLRNGVTWNLNIVHPGTTGSLQAKLNTATKVFVDDAAPIKLIFTDPMPTGTTGLFVKGDILQADQFSKRANISEFLRKTGTVGLLSGGSLSAGASPFDVDVAAGAGFVDDSSSVLTEVSWSGATLSFVSGDDFYITVDATGTIQKESSISDSTKRIILGRVAADLSEAQVVEKSRVSMVHHGNLVEDYLREALGPIYDTGSIVTESGTRNLDVSSGRYKFGTTTYNPSGGAPITWESYYRDGSGGFSEIDSETVVDNAFYDDGTGTLAALSAGFYAKHTLYTVGDGAEEVYFLVYSQAEYSSLVVAEAAALPFPPSYFRDALTIIATIIVKQGTANIVEIQDARPQIGFKATGVSASADHGNLLGLLDDDHPQYLLVAGSRAMSGDLNMGTHDITNVGLVDGVDVSAHTARHLPNGADPLATAAPIASLGATTTNDVGTANSFARSDHSHAISTAAASTQVPDQVNATGTSANLARADHVHNIPTAAPSGTIGANSTNSQGIAANFSRSDHGHQVATGAPSTQVPDQSNTAGSSNNLAKADHIHNIPAAAPITTLSPATTNAKGIAASFALSDHAHAVATSLAGDITTIQPDDTAAAGVVDKFARGDHKHAIVTAAAATQTPDQANAKGTSTSFARADHVHNIPAANVSTVGQANAKGTAASFALSDHVHNIGTTVQDSETSPGSVSPVQTWTFGSGFAVSSGGAGIANIALNIKRAIAEVNNTQAITSATFVDITGVTVTVPVTGTYLVIYSGTFTFSNASRTCDITLVNNGTAVTASQRQMISAGGGQSMTIMTFSVVSGTATQIIKAQAQVSSNTLTANQQAIAIFKIA